MSGYSSKAEVIEVIKRTIETDHNGTGLPRDPKRYKIEPIVRENFYNAGTYGWRSSTEANEFVASLRKNLRKK